MTFFNAAKFCHQSNSSLVEIQNSNHRIEIIEFMTGHIKNDTISAWTGVYKNSSQQWIFMSGKSIFLNFPHLLLSSDVCVTLKGNTHWVNIYNCSEKHHYVCHIRFPLYGAYLFTDTIRYFIAYILTYLS